ncbi:MAG: DUF58 domain-containing protein [Pyrinomonadaceae bacterium]
MKLRTLSQLFSLRDLRNALAGLIVVGGGIGLSALMIYALQSGNDRFAGFAVIVSLVFVLLILVFVVPPLVRSVGNDASQLNLPFDFTAGGAIVLGLIAIVGFSAWNTGNNLLFLILSFLTASMIVGFFAGNLVLKKLDVKMRFPETIFAEQETPILVSLTNRKRIFPSYSIVAEVRGRDREKSVAAEDLERLLPKWIAKRLSRPPVIRKTLSYFIYIPRGGTANEKTHHIFRRRGVFLIRDFELSTKFPFGFFSHRRRLRARETELIVFPPIDPLDHEIDNLPLEQGKLVANKRGMGQDLLALRNYRPNDDLRRIDWKATARSQQLTVREFAAEDDKRITIFFDPRIPEADQVILSLKDKIGRENSREGFTLSERFESGVRLTASLLGHFADQQAEFRLLIDDAAGEFGIGVRHLNECLKRLALIEPSVDGNIDELTIEGTIETFLDNRGDSHNLLVSAYGDTISPDIGERLRVIGY